MNAIKKFLAKLKFKKTLTVETMWMAEVIFSAILIPLLLVGDLWLYRNFVINKKLVSMSEGKAILLKKINLENIGKHIRAEKAFLDNPALPVVRSPF